MMHGTLPQCTRSQAKELRFNQLCSLCIKLGIKIGIRMLTCHPKLLYPFQLVQITYPFCFLGKIASSACKELSIKLSHIAAHWKSQVVCFTQAQALVLGNNGAAPDSRAGSSPGFCDCSGCILSAHHHDCHSHGGQPCIGPFPSL